MIEKGCESQTMIKKEHRYVLNSLTLLGRKISTKDQHIDSNIPISSQTNYYPFFLAILFLGHQLHPPALLPLPLAFNCNPGSSRLDSRSKAVMRAMTCFSCSHLNRTSRMHGNQTLGTKPDSWNLMQMKDTPVYTVLYIYYVKT